MFCGGRRCKYESSSNWKKDDVVTDGIYSHWITDDLLAMARPNTENMAKYKTVQQFKTLGIKSIINLQTPGNLILSVLHVTYALKVVRFGSKLTFFPGSVNQDFFTGSNLKISC